MLPNKAGQVVRFHTPFPDEDPNMIYNLLYLDEEDYPNRRADIRPISSSLSIPPINRVQLSDLEVVELDLNDLMMHKVTVIKEDNSEAIGRVVKLHQDKVIPELTVKEGKGVKTNALITVRDFDAQEHTGYLFVTPETRI
jgi:hypothetical protein